MKKLAILMVLAMEIAVGGCGSGKTTSNVVNTSTTGNWEAQFTVQSGTFSQASLLDFVTTFSVTNNGPLDISALSFFNDGSCFSTTKNANGVGGNASFTTNTATGQVTGNLNLTVTSNTTGSVLSLMSLPDGLTGTSNGTTTTTGTLTNGTVVGTFTLTPGASASSCTGTGTFIMCQDPNSQGVCVAPAQ